MNVHPLVYPGVSIQMENLDLAMQIQDELSSIQSYFDELVVLANLFQDSYAEEGRLFAAAMEPPQREAGVTTAADDLQATIEKIIESPHTAVEQMRAWHTTCIEQQLRRWAQGETPRAYMACRPTMYARAFVFTLSTIVGLLEQLGRKADIPEQAKSAAVRLRKNLPGLKALRDSSAHVDERMAGRARGRPIVPAAVDNQVASAPAGAFMLVEDLIGEEFVSTGADGSHVSVVVSHVTVSEVRRVLQEVLLAFKWDGLVRVHPES